MEGNKFFKMRKFLMPNLLFNLFEETTFKRQTIRKGVSVLLFIAFFNSSVIAQNNITYGVKGGVNVNALQYKDISDEDQAQLSFHIGGLAHIHLNKTWAIQPEILLSREGGKEEYSGSTMKWKIYYLNIPVMLQYMFAKGFRLEAGPEFGFRIGANVSNNGGSEVGATSAYNQLNFAAAAGVSYLSKYNIGVGLRYCKGLVDVTQGSYNYVSTNTAQLSLYYMLPKRHRR